MEEAGIGLEAVEHVAVNSNPQSGLLKKIGFALYARPDLGLLLDRIRNQEKRRSIERELARVVPGARFKGVVHRIEHHLAHLASSFLVSPFENAVTVSIDGFGDFSSAAWGTGQGNEITVDGRVHFPHSLGIFYQALTQYLGFPHYGDEYKVMGLAPYGEPRQLDDMRQIVRLDSNGSFSLDTTYFKHHKQKISYEWSGGTPVVGRLYSDALTDLLGPARQESEPLERRHFDIACSVQAMYEEALFHLLETVHADYRQDSLTLAGGCALNSVANGKVRRRTSFKRLYAQPAAGDAGGAIGAALVVWNKVDGNRCRSVDVNGSALPGDHTVNRVVMDHAYWGPQFGDEAVSALLASQGDTLNAHACIVEKIADETELCRRTAEAIADGQVVGWFQGRMEWGPRALGNRSIICDPRRADMKDILNCKIKRRETFRPFAPAVLREHMASWFVEDDDVPFMTQVLQVRREKRPLIPAVTHVDGSGRLQTVHRRSNARFWGLIDAFRQLTDVPMVLNTSFNENEPVVCRPEEALACFLRTEMDMLVLGTTIVLRTSSEPQQMDWRYSGKRAANRKSLV